MFCWDAVKSRTDVRHNLYTDKNNSNTDNFILNDGVIMPSFLLLKRTIKISMFV